MSSLELDRNEFLDLLQRSYEFYAIRSLKDKNVPISKENIRHEVKLLILHTGAEALVGIRRDP